MARILLVDDDIELVHLLQEYLEQEGYEVSAVHNGEEGAEAALSGQYALAVLDVMMPVMNGIETLRRIRAQSTMPVLMLTAKGDDLDRILGLELGADDYVPKPCTPRELTARIRAILRRAEASEPAEQPRQLVLGALTMWPEQRRAEWDGRLLELTSSESTPVAR